MSISDKTSEQNRKLWMANHPGWMAILFIIGLSWFSLWAWQVKTNGRLVQGDPAFSSQLHQIALRLPPFLTQLAIGGSFLGREMPLLLCFAFGAWWLYQRRWRLVVMIALGPGGGEVWFELLSRYFHRHRPVLPNPVEVLPGSGFPSGHCITAVVFYGLLAYVYAPYLSTPTKRALLWAGMIAIMMIIGIGRLYVGDHYLTDVLAGYGFGLAWGSLAYTFVELLAKYGIIPPQPIEQKKKFATLEGRKLPD